MTTAIATAATSKIRPVFSSQEIPFVRICESKTVMLLPTFRVRPLEVQRVSGGARMPGT